MIDHQVGWDQWIGELGIGAHVAEGIAHRGQVDHAGNARKILQENTSGPEIDLLRRRADLPFRDIFNVGFLNGASVFRPQQVLDQDLDRIRNPGKISDAGFLERLERVDAVAASAGRERGSRSETVR